MSVARGGRWLLTAFACSAWFVSSCDVLAQTATAPRSKVFPIEKPLPLEKPPPINDAEATARIRATNPEFVFTCRAGASTNFKLAVLTGAARTQAPANAFWSVRATFRVAPFMRSERPLQPGECKLPSADFVDAPVVNLWRYLDVSGTRYSPPNGLQGVWMVPGKGIITVTAVDTVFRDFLFRLSDSRTYDGRPVRPGGGSQVIEPGQPFEVRVTRMPCARDCTGFVPPSWEFYVVAAPLR